MRELKMLNLIGVHECKADTKGRLLLPAALKKQLLPSLDRGFVLKRSVFQNCLEMYPMEEWEAVMGQINQLNRFVKKNNDFIRMFTAGVKVIEVDGSGRILIPKDLMQFAGIKNQLVLSSSVNMIEIWDKMAYEAVLSNPEVDFGSLAEGVMGGAKSSDHGLS